VAWSRVGALEIEVAIGASTESKTLPGTPLEDDIVILLLGCDDNLSTAVPHAGGADGGVDTTGYIGLHTSSSANPGQQLSYKLMGSTPDSSVVIEQDGTRIISGCLQVWRETTDGIDTANPIDNSVSTATGGSGAPNSPSHTTLTDNALRVICGIQDDDNVRPSVAAPSGYTNLTRAETSSAGGAGNTTMMASKTEATAGSDDPAVWSAASDAWFACHFALRPFVEPSGRIMSSLVGGGGGLIGQGGLIGPGGGLIA
jgi:hypothetical protein